MGEGDTLANGLIGAIVTVVTVSFIPFSPLLGGAVSGYLQGGETEEAIKVGVLSGLIALVPLFALLVFVGNIFLFILAVGATGPAGLISGLGFVVVVFVALAFLLYVLCLSVVGGWLGNYLKRETDIFA